MKIIFQGVPYPDPNQDLEAEKEEKAKKGGKDKKGSVEAEPEIRYLTPDPVQLDAENGRVFQFEIGKYVKELSSEHTKEELDELKEKNEEIPEDWYVDKWVRYYMDQKARPMTHSSREAGASKMPGEESMKESVGAAMEEIKSVASKQSKASKVEPTASLNMPTTMAPTTIVYPEPSEEMFAYVNSVGGLVELKDIFLKCDN